MSGTNERLSVKEFKLCKQIVRQSTWPPGEAEEDFHDRVVDQCLDALQAGRFRRSAIEADVVALCQYYKRRTKNDFFAEQETLLGGKKRGRTEDGGGPRKRQKFGTARAVTLSGAPMSPARDADDDGTWNSGLGTPYTLYSGTLTYTFDSLVAPPSPTRTDWPSTTWDPTGQPLPANSVKHVPRQTLDPVRLKRWQRLDRRGFDSQNAIMGGWGAASVAASAGVIPHELDKVPTSNYGNSAWEWLHLVSFKMGGINDIPQQPANLVAGTYECNSLMISIEEAIKDLVLIDQLTLALEVKATCRAGTHLGERINYDVYYKDSKGTEIPFKQVFDPLSHMNPIHGDKAIFVKAMRRTFGLEQ